MRLASGPLAPRLEWQSLEEVVGSVLGRLRHEACGARIEARVEPALPLVRGDATLLAQLLSNLLDNACKYSAGAILLSACRAPEAVVMSVADRGPGIDPEDEARLFEPFFRVEAKGTGEGAGPRSRALPRHRRSARRHPRLRPPPPRRQPLHPDAADRAAAGGRGMTLKVLVVEDDAGIRGLLRASLAAEGFAVTTAVSLSEAMALLQHDPPGLIVLDLGLPDGDGADLVRAVRQRSSLPIVVASARAEPAGKIALLDAGADDYLVKPFSVAELLARIRVALRHRGSVLQPALRHFSGDGLSIDLDTRRVERDGEAVHLTPTEFELLARLLRSAGHIVTHRQLLVDVWGAEHAADTHYLRLYMGQLRAKLERSPSEPRFLLTEIGVGYRFAVD